MKEFDWDKLWLGIVFGLVIPTVTYGLYYLVVNYFNLRQVNISLCMVTNLIPFYISLNREKYNFTKGVILITIVTAILITSLGYFTNIFKFY